MPVDDSFNLRLSLRNPSLFPPFFSMLLEMKKIFLLPTLQVNP